MSKGAEQSLHTSKGTAEQSLHSYQSVWMAHWARTRCNSVSLTQDQLSDNHESMENNSEAKRNWIVSRPNRLCELVSKQFCEVAASGSVKMQNENSEMISENVTKESLAPHPFAFSGLSPNGDGSWTLKNDQAANFFAESLRPHVDTNTSPLCLDRKERTSFWARPVAETQSRECHLEFRGSTCNSGMPVKSPSFHEKKKLAVSSSFHDNNASTSSQGILDGPEAGGTPIVTSLDRQKDITRLTTSLTAKGHFRNIQFSQLQNDHRDYNARSEVYIGEKKDESMLHSHIPETAACDGAPLLNEPMTSKHPTKVLVGKKHLKIQDNFTNNFFPCQSSPPESSKPEKLHQEYSSRPGPSFHDVETMKMCTTEDSAEGFSSFQPKVSQTTHHLFFRKEFGVDLSKGVQIIKESPVSAKRNGHAFGEVLSLPPNIFSSQHGVNLQPLWSSTDSEEKEDAADGRTSALAIKNESSAETDTMDMDAFRENHLSGDASSPVNKDIAMPQKLSLSLAAAASAGEVGGKAVIGDLPKTELPKRKYHELTSLSGSIDEREPSTSKTQSLDMEHLFSHADQATDSKTQTYFCSHGGPEQRTGWLKRLKMSTSETVRHGGESLKLGDAFSSGEDNNSVGKVMKQRTTSPEQIIGSCEDTEQTVLGQFSLLAKDGGSSFSDSVGKSRDALLSHPWIQRWCRNQATSLQKKPEAVVLCEPHSTKASVDEHQKRQFPSTAAMALMGKAMNGFHPCEFRKRGTYVVWNTK